MSGPRQGLLGSRLRLLAAIVVHAVVTYGLVVADFSRSLDAVGRGEARGIFSHLLSALTQVFLFPLGTVALVVPKLAAIARDHAILFYGLNSTLWVLLMAGLVAYWRGRAPVPIDS